LRVVDVETGQVIYSGSGNYERGALAPPQRVAENIVNAIISFWLAPGFIGFTQKNGLIFKVYPDSPADQRGLQVGDKIEKINGVEVSGLSSLEINKLLSGQVGEKLALEVLREGKTKHFEMVRIDKKKYWERLKDKGIMLGPMWG
jgi:S1-C subfamily serine protease